MDAGFWRYISHWLPDALVDLGCDPVYYRIHRLADLMSHDCEFIMWNSRVVILSVFSIILCVSCRERKCPGPVDELPAPILSDLPMERFSPDVAELAEEEWFIKKNCTLESPVHVPAGAVAVAILATGTACEGEWPLLRLRVNERMIGMVRVCSSRWGWYVVPITGLSDGDMFRITFSNDRYTGNEDINIHIRKVVFLGVR